MAWELSDGLKIGAVIGAISTSFAVNRNKIKILFRKTDRHQDTLFGSDKEGGLISDVQGTKKDVEYIKDDVRWIRNHMENGGKKK